MSILLCVSIASVIFCLLSVGLGLIFLLIVEHLSNTFQATIDDEGISEPIAPPSPTYYAGVAPCAFQRPLLPKNSTAA
jgi:hypothetical protein